MASGRLAKDVQYLQRHISAQTNGQAKVTDVDDNLEFLLLTMMPNEGFYRGADIKFKIKFTECYPEEVPLVQCLDNVYHPNISVFEEEESDDVSNVCVSLLDEWVPSMGLDHIVMAVLFLLYNPNPEDALSPYFDDSLVPEDLEENIRKSLRGETVEGVSWPRLLVEDADDASEEVKPGDGESVTQTAMDSKQTTDDSGEVLTSNENETMEKSSPLTESLATVSAPLSNSTTTIGSKDSDSQNLWDAISTISDSNISKVSPLDSFILSFPNTAVTDVITQTFKDSSVIRLDSADHDCRNSDSECYSDSLGIGRLFSCASSRATGSRIKALFSCFCRRDATAQFQTPNMTDSGDCEVD